MRMAVYKLVTKEIYDINNVVMLLFLAYLGIEQHMEKHVAELLGQFVFVACQDGSVELIYLFYRLRTKRLIGLLAVPRAFFPKFVKDVQNSSECLQFFFSCMHVCVFCNSINRSFDSTSFRSG